MKYNFHLDYPIPAARPVVLASHTFNPKSVKLKKNVEQIKVQCLQIPEYRHLLTSPIKVGIKVTIKYTYIKAAKNKKKHHTQKPDLDNLVKFTLDVLTRSILVDDAYVIEIHATKSFADAEGVLIEIETVEEEDGSKENLAEG